MKEVCFNVKVIIKGSIASFLMKIMKNILIKNNNK